MGEVMPTRSFFYHLLQWQSYRSWPLMPQSELPAMPTIPRLSLAIPS
jgi:hypothetical protein